MLFVYFEGIDLKAVDLLNIEPANWKDLWSKPPIFGPYYNNDNHLTKYGHKLYYECIRDEFLIKFK